MALDTLQAATHYNDLKGGGAADRADLSGPEEWLRKNGHMTVDEFMVGIDFSVGGNHSVQSDPIDVYFLVFEASGNDNVAGHIAGLPADEPIDVRRVSVKMPLAEFFSLFKRFNVTLSSLEAMQGRAYRYAD